MSKNNYWLYDKLKEKGAKILSGPEPLIEVQGIGKIYKIYTPCPQEYMITVDIVNKVKMMGGNTISYPGWSRASHESIEFGEFSGVEVVPHGELFTKV